MKTTITLCFVPLLATVLFAQGPRGGRGFEGPGGFGGRGAGLLGAGPGSRMLVTGAPFSAVETLQTQQTLANGNQISNKVQSNVYRDGQGRIRTEETRTPPASSGKAASTIVTIFDPVAGFRYVLDSSTMIAYQSPLPKSNGTPPARPAPPARPNETSASLGTQVINGVSATGTQLTETIPAGAIGNAQAIQVVRITWISTELKVPVEIKTHRSENRQQRHGTHEYRANRAECVVVRCAGRLHSYAGWRGPWSRRTSRRCAPWSRPPVESPYGYSRRTFVLEGAAVIDTDAVEAAKALLPP